MRYPRLLVATVALLVGCLASTPGFAQEVQVSVDQEGQILVIDEELANDLNMFQEYAGFVEARLFQLSDDVYELAIQYRDNGQVLRVRQELTQSDVNDLREQVSERLAARQPEVAFEDGRWKMLLTTTAFGGIHGALLPASLGADSGRIMGALPPLGAALGFGIPFYLTQSYDVSQAEATMTLYGSTQGLSHGLLLTLMLAEPDWDSRAVFGVMSLMSMGQGIAGFTLTDRSFSAGSAEAMAFGSLFGHGYGLGASVLILGDDPDFDDIARIVSGSILASSIAGSYIGYEAAQSRGYTQGDSRINLLTGGLGLQAATTGLYLADVDDPRTFAALAMTGTSLGLFSGWRLLKDHNFTRGQSNLISLGTIAGGFLAGSISTLADASPKVSSTLSLLGSVGGFGFSYVLLSDDARVGAGGNLRMSINPFGGATPFSKPGEIQPAIQLNYQF